MIGVRFSKNYAIDLFDAIRTGQPLPMPPSGKWSQLDMLAAAGALYAAVLSHGSIKARMDGVDLSKLHSEKREAVEVTLRHDIQDAIEFLGVLTLQVEDDEYDANCEPEAQAVLYRKQDDTTCSVPVSGFKRPS